MSDRIVLEEDKMPAVNPTGVVVKSEDGSAACPMQGKGWLKGPLGMAVCCGVPLFLVAAISLFGLSLGAVANGLLSFAVVLACPLGMYLMMRMFMRNQK